MVGVRDVAAGEWFYGYPKLNLQELELVIKFVDLTDAYACTVATLLLACSVVPQIAGRLVANPHDCEARLMLEMLVKTGLYGEETSLVFGSRSLASLTNPKVADFGYELFRKEGAERPITGIENAGWPYLDKLLQGDCTFMHDPHQAVHWLEYFFLQLFRTPKFKQAMVQFAEEEGISEKSSCNVSSYVGLILAVETSATAMRNFNSLEFKILHNNTKISFVTGDAPFIEVGDSATNNLIFPLSPQLAFYLGDKTAPSFPHRYDNMTDDTVLELNERLVAQCVNQVYAEKISDLATFDKFKGGI